MDSGGFFVFRKQEGGDACPESRPAAETLIQKPARQTRGGGIS